MNSERAFELALEMADAVANATWHGLSFVYDIAYNTAVELWQDYSATIPGQAISDGWDEDL